MLSRLRRLGSSRYESKARAGLSTWQCSRGWSRQATKRRFWIACNRWCSGGSETGRGIGCPGAQDQQDGRLRDAAKNKTMLVNLLMTSRSLDT